MQQTAIVALVIALIIAILGWIKFKLSFYSLIYYMQEKGYEQPEDGEIKACTQKVVELLFNSNKNRR